MAGHDWKKKAGEGLRRVSLRSPFVQELKIGRRVEIDFIHCVFKRLIKLSNYRFLVKKL